MFLYLDRRGLLVAELLHRREERHREETGGKIDLQQLRGSSSRDLRSKQLDLMWQGRMELQPAVEGAPVQDVRPAPLASLEEVGDLDLPGQLPELPLEVEQLQLAAVAGGELVDGKAGAVAGHRLGTFR